MEIILVLAGLGIAIWALSALFSPPKKHKDFTLHDRDEATARALGDNFKIVYRSGINSYILFQ